LCSARENDLSIRHSLSDQNYGDFCGDLTLEKLDQQIFAYAVNGKYRIALIVADNR
jgi:hypothetical protein